MDLKGKKVLVVGLGKSGFASAKFLKQKDALVTATDIAKESKYKKELLSLGIKLELGFHSEETIKNSDLIVVSPGVPLTALKFAEKEKIIGEIELAYRFIDEPIIAITGSNGKTTVTMLISEMLKNCGFKVFTCGNIGTPLIDYVNKKEKADFLVVEISSFQLDTIKTFKPKIAVLLNITEDHIDRYESFEHYKLSKLKIFENQNSNDFAILSKKLNLPNIKAKKEFFDDCEIDIKIDENKFIGKHNKDNIYAATKVAMLLSEKNKNKDLKKIEEVLKFFKMPSHRIEFIKKINDVSFYDDSKGTNPDATLKAIESFDENIVLIMGGLSKGEDYAILKNAIGRNVKKLILMGKSKDMMKAIFKNIADITEVDSMKEAVEIAKKSAKKNDVVLLSPATASFDKYKNYKDRGNDFKKCVCGTV